jgi:hypothetical protein
MSARWSGDALDTAIGEPLLPRGNDQPLDAPHSRERSEQLRTHQSANRHDGSGSGLPVAERLPSADRSQ